MRIEIADMPERIQKQILRKLNEQTIRENEKKRRIATSASPPRNDGEKKGNKLHAEKTDGYASKHEAERARQLRILEKAGEISGLREQVEYELLPTVYETEDGEIIRVSGRENKKEAEKATGKKLKIIERRLCYVLDFQYTDNKTGKTVYEDAKGYKGGATYQIFVCKRKLMMDKFGIRVREV